MALESEEVRLARVEERVGDLEHWRDVLNADIAKTEAVIERMADKFDARMDGIEAKLDTTLDVSRRSLPTWAHYTIWVLIALLGVAGGLVAAHGGF